MVSYVSAGSKLMVLSPKRRLPGSACFLQGPGIFVSGTGDFEVFSFGSDM